MKSVGLLFFACACTAAGTEEAGWISLFDGDTLAGWTETNFGGQAEVHVEDGQLILENGDPLTGISWDGEFPRLDYEVRLEATRLLGTDFFCGLTFPVGDSYCSLILGGWGGSLVGLSNVDGHDASENATRSYMSFSEGQTYRIHLRVTTAAIQAWVDGEPIVDQPREGHTFGIRPEVLLSRPFGIASFATATALNGIQMRPLDVN